MIFHICKLLIEMNFVSYLSINKISCIVYCHELQCVCVYCAYLLFVKILCACCHLGYVVCAIYIYCYKVAGLISKNRLPYNLYCVDGDVKHCTIQKSRK